MTGVSAVGTVTTEVGILGVCLGREREREKARSEQALY